MPVHCSKLSVLHFYRSLGNLESALLWEYIVGDFKIGMHFSTAINGICAEACKSHTRCSVSRGDVIYHDHGQKYFYSHSNMLKYNMKCNEVHQTSWKCLFQRFLFSCCQCADSETWLPSSERTQMTPGVHRLQYNHYAVHWIYSSGHFYFTLENNSSLLSILPNSRAS